MTVLQDHLDEITANTRNLVQPERMAVSERAVQELLNSGIRTAFSRSVTSPRNSPFQMPRVALSGQLIYLRSDRSSSTSFVAAGAPTALLS